MGQSVRVVIELDPSRVSGPEEASEVVAGLGVEVTGASRVLPYVYGMMGARGRAALERHPWVLTVSGDAVVGVQGHLPVLTPEQYRVAHKLLPSHVGDFVGTGASGGAGAKIAVVDTGVSRSHPALASKVVGGVNYSGDPDGDAYGHGSHVAGIAAGGAAETNYGTFHGIAPGAGILDVKVLGDNGSGLMSDVMRGMEWAVDNGADVVNLSLGMPFRQPADCFFGDTDATSTKCGEGFMVANLAEALSARAVVCVAAGNDGRGGADTIMSPGVAPSAYTVGAMSMVTAPGTRSPFSSQGPGPGPTRKPDFALPGGYTTTRAEDWEVIYAPSSGILDEQSDHVENGWAPLVGTSMAAPVAAGLAARGISLERFRSGAYTASVGHDWYGQGGVGGGGGGGGLVIAGMAALALYAMAG